MSQNVAKNWHFRCRGVAKYENRVPTLGAECIFLLLSPSVGIDFCGLTTPLQRERQFFGRNRALTGVHPCELNSIMNPYEHDGL